MRQGGSREAAPARGLGRAGLGELGREAHLTCAVPREQAQLKARVVDRDTEAWQRDPAFSGLQRVGGVDVSFVKGDSVNACASLVVLSYPELEVTPGGTLAGTVLPGPRVRRWAGRGSGAGNDARVELGFSFCRISGRGWGGQKLKEILLLKFELTLDLHLKLMVTLGSPPQ